MGRSVREVHLGNRYSPIHTFFALPSAGCMKEFGAWHVAVVQITFFTWQPATVYSISLAYIIEVFEDYIMKRVAMLLTNPFRPDPRVLKEARSLAEIGYDVTVICWDRTSEMKPQEIIESSFRVVRIQSVPSSYGRGVRQLLRLPLFWIAVVPLLNRLQPDLIHCHDFDTLPAALFWGRFHRRPVVYDAHEYYAELCKPRLHGTFGIVLHWFIRVGERIGAHMASAVVTVDETLGEIYRKSNQQVVVIGHYPNRSFAARPSCVFTHSELRLLYIGRISVDRGLLIYVELLRYLREWGIPARLCLAGAFVPSEEEQRLHDCFQWIGGSLDLRGWVSYNQIPALLQSADVGLAILQPEPYYQAALPVKVFEYMAAGLPIVASDFPLISSVIKDAQCGVVVDPLDSEVAAKHIRYWWEHPEEARMKGKNGRQAVLQKYNWENLVQRLDNLYSSLLSHNLTF